MFGLFKKKVNKEELDILKQAVQTGFNSAKQDIGKLSVWVKHLDSKDNQLKYQIFELQEELSRVKDQLEEMKNKEKISIPANFYKQKQTVFNKQTPSIDVLNTVQTDVQTGIIDNLSIMERAIISILLNSDMKLSYEDLAAMMGKRRATIRGQINSIKQKSEGLIEEIIGENSKKRIYIPDEIKEILLKTKKTKDKERKRIENKENY